MPKWHAWFSNFGKSVHISAWNWQFLYQISGSVKYFTPCQKMSVPITYSRRGSYTVHKPWVMKQPNEGWHNARRHEIFHPWFRWVFVCVLHGPEDGYIMCTSQESWSNQMEGDTRDHVIFHLWNTQDCIQHQIYYPGYVEVWPYRSASICICGSNC